MVPSFGRPTLEDPLDVSPIPAPVVYRFDDRSLNPAHGIPLERLGQLLGNKWRQGANILLVQCEDIGAFNSDPLHLAL